MSLLRYRLGTARHDLVRRWRERPLRLREPFFAPERELRRIERRCRAVLADGAAELHVFESHQPVLLELLHLVPRARVLELGLGYGSTPIVLGRSRSSLSLETDPRWHARFAPYSSDEHRIVLWRDYDEWAWRCPYLDEPWDVVLVDHSPAHSRQASLIRLAARSRFVVCHDTEECFKPAASDYRWDFSGFAHVWTYTRFGNYTTVASNFEPIPLAHLGGVTGIPAAAAT